MNQNKKEAIRLQSFYDFTFSRGTVLGATLIAITVFSVAGAIVIQTGKRTR